MSNRRTRLLETAPGLLCRRGYAATSLRELAAQAGCSKAALYHHFPTKDDLLAELAEPLLRSVDDILATISLDVARADDQAAIVRAYILALSTHREVGRVLLVDTAGRATPAGQRALDQQRALVARLAGPRASLRQQVRARCAVAIANLVVGDLMTVAVHRLNPPLIDAAVDTLRGGATSAAASAVGSTAPLPRTASPV